MSTVCESEQVILSNYYPKNKIIVGNIEKEISLCGKKKKKFNIVIMNLFSYPRGSIVEFKNMW